MSFEFSAMLGVEIVLLPISLELAILESVILDGKCILLACGWNVLILDVCGCVCIGRIEESCRGCFARIS